MDLIIDVQGFNGPDNKFILKELAALTIDGSQFEHYLFTSSCSYNSLTRDLQKLASKATNKHHGITWNSGLLDASKIKYVLERLLVRSSGKVFVKGEENKQWLRKFTAAEIVNVEKFGCPNFDTLHKQLRDVVPEVTCFAHKISKPLCAVQNTHLLFGWYNEYSRNQNSAGEDTCGGRTQGCVCF